MTLNEIRHSVQQLTELVNAWKEDAAISTLERDMVLEKLRQLYEAIRFENYTPSDHLQPEDTIPVITEVTPPDTTAEGAESKETEEGNAPEEVATDTPEALDLSSMLALEPEAENTNTDEVTLPKNTEESTEQSTNQPVVATLFGPSEESARHRHKQRVILSLYGVEPEPEPSHEEVTQPISPKEQASESTDEPTEVTPEAEVTPANENESTIAETMELTEPIGPKESEQTEETNSSEKVELSETSAVLGEVIAPHVQTLGDSLQVESEPTIGMQQAGCDDLHQIIGLNDKFLLIRDLFNGDEDLFENTISKINEFDNLDDCLIYLAENFIWNPDSDGVRLLIELLDRKFV